MRQPSPAGNEQPRRLRQRASQADIQGDWVGDVGRRLTVFGRNEATSFSDSDTSNGERSDSEQHANNHAAHRGGQISVGPVSHQCRTTSPPSQSKRSLIRRADWGRSGGDDLAAMQRSGALTARLRDCRTLS